MRPVIAILVMLAAPASALAQVSGNPPLLIPAPPAPTPPPLFVPPPVPSVVTPLPTPSYGVPPGVGSNANVPLSGGGTVRSVYRGSDSAKPRKKKRWRKRYYQSSTR
jgi:hypothetical protein